MTWDLVGYFASFCVLGTFCMRSMRRLRGFAIASNFAFIAYGLPLRLWPIVALHALLLPVNVIRLREAWRAEADGSPLSHDGPSGTFRSVERQPFTVPSRDIAG